MNPKQTLKQHFGYDSFREGQEPLINDILQGKDALGIMPTGAGKSLCFQIPALISEGITIIVSPLISLMRDQVIALAQAGIPAAYINSSLNERQIHKALLNAQNNMYKLIYIAPERLLTRDFLYFAVGADISMVTVDEAHCISQWGQDFRPSYTEIPKFIAHLHKRPVVSAFTATATPRVREDIINQLALDNPTILVSGFDRPNLHFDIKKAKDKLPTLTEFLLTRRNQSGIVYCATRATVEEVCEKLNKYGYSASRYHAGLSDHERLTNQDDFLHDRVQIMVATNAFGMGIDKSNVSFVVHYNMPKDLEGYYQEAGRAGRDGEPAECLMLYSKGDVSTNLWLINNNQESEPATKERNIKRLQEMEFFSTTKECLREFILRYFGETPKSKCNNCVNCEASYEDMDITIESQKIISCVIRMNERFGIGIITDVLRGKNNAKVVSFRLDKLSTFGISNKSKAELTDIIDHLVLYGYLRKTADQYPVVKLTAKSKDLLRQGASISMKTSRKSSKRAVTSIQPPLARVADRNLLEALKQLRLSIAKEQNLPAFVIFHDSTLTDMCEKMPGNLDEFMNVSGVGQVKAEKYGARFIEVIQGYVAK